MSMFDPRAAAAVALAVALSAPLAAGAADKLPAGPGLGQDAPAALVAKWDISITPDGAGLPPGSGSALQGAPVYARACQSCHGPNGAGGRGATAAALTGGIGTLATDDPVKTVNSYWPYATTAFDYIRRAMPLTTPQSLNDDEVYGLVAFILSIDGLVKAADVLDAKTLPNVQMPNRNGFVNFWPEPPKAFKIGG